MVRSATLTRIKKELEVCASDPPEFIHLRCDEEDVMKWHYLVEGPPDSPYHGGWYWGILQLPANYPMSPPSIKMLTPNGRFQVNVRLCLSMSDFHPESWSPGWWLTTIMKGLLSFMCDEELTTGSIFKPSKAERARLCANSLEWTKTQADFQEAFPDIDKIVSDAKARPQGPSSSADGASRVAAGVAEGAAGGAEVTTEAATAESSMTVDAAEGGEAERGSGDTRTGVDAAATGKIAAALPAAPEASTETPAPDPKMLGPCAEPDENTMVAGVEADVACEKDHEIPCFTPGDSVMVRISKSMEPELQALLGMQGLVQKSGRPGLVRVRFRGSSGMNVNMHVLPEKIQRFPEESGA